MQDFLVHHATAADWQKLPLIYEADGYQGAAAGMRKRASAELEQFRAGDRILFLAECGDQTIGTVGLVFRGLDSGYADGETSVNISRLHVVKAYRRGGVGTALMAAAEREACNRSYRRLVLDVETEDDTAAARALYEKLGFQYVGPGHASNDLAMAKQLA